MLTRCLSFVAKSPCARVRQLHWKQCLTVVLVLNVLWISLMSARLFAARTVETKFKKSLKLADWILPEDSKLSDTDAKMLADMASKAPVEGVSCYQIIYGAGNQTWRKSRAEMFRKGRARDMSAFLHLDKTWDCTRFREDRGYFMKPGSQEEENFPIAYSIITYKEFQQVERLLRAIYRPHNHYCIHYDQKSDPGFQRSLKNLANCFENVFIASRIIPVHWGKFSVLEADLICMEDLLKRPGWKYLINLTGQEFPLKTNWQIVRILTAYQGANDSGATRRRRNQRRTKRWEPAPYNITIFKGPVHVVLSWAFVDFMFNNVVAQTFLNWTKKTIIPDETFFVSLQHNPHIGTPGAFNGTLNELERKFSMARYKLWAPRVCKGKRVRQICIFSEKDLPSMRDAPQLFANKFHFDFGQLAYECLDELLWNRTRDEYLYGVKLNTTFYEQLSLVKHRVNLNNYSIRHDIGSDVISGNSV